MEHYVTLFDSLFLPQGLALHMSMERHAGSYTLWILCVNDEAFQILNRLCLPNVRLLQLNQLETIELKNVKNSRSKGEYCWTLTPFAPRFVFESDPTVTRVTYVDADIWLRKSPSPIFEELEKSTKYVLITDHSYAPEYDLSATSGQYCVQFMTFYKEEGEVVRKWWEERCIEWCFARSEDGKFGDQMYLDDWPNRFKNLVHVLEHKEWTQAPWNATQYPFSQGIFYHFQGLRILHDRKIDFGSIYGLPRVLINNIYHPYVRDISKAKTILNNVDFDIIPQAIEQNLIMKIRRLISGIYHQLWRFHSLNYIKF